MITVLMYHYVRKIKKSSYPNIKGLELDLFKQQIRYLKKYYEFIDYNDLVENIYGSKKLKKNSILLTFDDGFIDNYEYVFPILFKENIKACFYPITSTISENKISDVHKIHFILENINNLELIKRECYKVIKNLKKDNVISESYEEIYNKLAFSNEDDNKDIIFFKRLFQHYLKSEIRTDILNKLFLKYVNQDQVNFSKNLYLNLNHIKEMSKYGMTFGNHTHNHNWLGKLNKKKQKLEIENSLDFLNASIDNFKINNWTIAYPYGSYNLETIKICKQMGCTTGFTTNVNITTIEKNNALTLERLDTNNLPKNVNSSPNIWTSRVLS